MTSPKSARSRDNAVDLAQKRLHRDLLDHPGHLVRRLHQISVSTFLDVLADLGITSTQYAVLAAIGSCPNIDQTALAGLIGIDKSTAGLIATRLVKRGLIDRKHNAQNKRVMALTLTAEGVTAYKKALTKADLINDRLLGPLSKAEREVLIKLIKKVVGANNEISRAPLQLKFGDMHDFDPG
jgi:DNA-binding MarR family transcriptional regulator